MWLEPVIKECIPSTNRYIKEKHLPAGSVVIAKKQTDGRGRRGNSWCSDVEGNIYMSVAFTPYVPPDKIPLLSLASGLAVRNTLDFFGIESYLKWPNDVICMGKKICGIMSELANGICITGIGLNLKKLPDYSNLPFATSAEELGFSLKPEAVIKVLLQNLEYEFNNLENITEKYARFCITVGKEVLINNAEKATAIGIAEDGSLIINKNGEVSSVNCGDVSVRGICGYI